MITKGLEKIGAKIYKFAVVFFDISLRQASLNSKQCDMFQEVETVLLTNHLNSYFTKPSRVVFLFVCFRIYPL